MTRSWGVADHSNTHASPWRNASEPFPPRQVLESPAARHLTDLATRASVRTLAHCERPAICRCAYVVLSPIAGSIRHMDTPGLRLVGTDRTPAPANAPSSAPPTSEAIGFTLKGAAKACGVDPQTIRRKADQLKENGAVQHPDKSWSIPYRALLAAGFHPGKPSPPERTSVDTPAQLQVIPGAAPPSAPGAHPPADAAHRAELAQRIEQLERQLFEERVRREAAELVAAEREKRAETAERALLMLESREAREGRTPAAAPPTSPEPPQVLADVAQPAADITPTIDEVTTNPPRSRGRLGQWWDKLSSGG